MKNFRLIIAFLIAPLAAPIISSLGIIALSLGNLSGLFMVLWIVFVLLIPFSYGATFFFAILAATILKKIILKSKSTLILYGTIFGVATMFVLCYLTPFFSRDIIFVLSGGVMGLGVSYVFSLISGIPAKARSSTSSITA